MCCTLGRCLDLSVTRAIVPDGYKLIGTIHRPDGDHPVEWLHIGPSCG